MKIRQNYLTRTLFTVLIIVLFFACPVFAQEEIKSDESVEQLINEELKWIQEETKEVMVTTATRTEIPLLKATKSISVVSQKDMNDAQEYFLPEMIDNIPGVFFKRNGGVGMFSRINMRGAESQYVQFQYNGIPLKDAADLQNTFQPFIQDLNIGTNHRIEVLRGTNSTLYGSQAMAGVINIIPDKWKKGLVLESRNEIGENSTYIGSARAAYGKDRYFIDINPVYIDTDGENNDGEYDYYYKKIGFTAGAGVKLSDDISLEFNSLFSGNEAAMNNNTPSLDSDHNLVKNQASGTQELEHQIYQAGLVFNHKISSIWDYALKGSYSGTKRSYFWSEVSGDESVYKGSTGYLEMQHNIYPVDWLTLTIGADYEKSDYDDQEPFDSYQGIYDQVHFEHDWDFWDAFANLQFSFLDDSLLFSTGARYNDHEEFDGKGVWEISGAYIFEKTGTKLHAHAGTGYRTPSIYEIYGGYLFMGEFIGVGNPELEPEESTGYEIGLDQFLWKNRINMGITYFKTDFESLVVYDLLESIYKNAAEAKTEGAEGYLHFMPCKYFKTSLAYTYTDSKYKDNLTGEWIRKEQIPRNKVNLTAAFYPVENLTAFFRVTWMDEKIVALYDPDFTQVRWEEDSVTTVDMALSYKISKNFDTWIRVENLFDKDYSEGGYTMPGRWFYGGVKISF